MKKNGEEFVHQNYWGDISEGWILIEDTIKRLRNGNHVDWGDVVGTYEEDQKEMTEGPQDVLEELKGVFETKNDDYGNSWEKVGVLKRVMADEEGPEIVTLSDGREAVVLSDTPQATSTFEENADDVITRLLDKLVRAYNLIFLKDEPDVENESTVDAAKDMTGYSAMLSDLIKRA